MRAGEVAAEGEGVKFWGRNPRERELRRLHRRLARLRDDFRHERDPFHRAYMRGQERAVRERITELMPAPPEVSS